MSLAERIHNRLIELNKTLALAESCTGGQLAARLTALPDASKYFLGSLVTYSDQLKEGLLQVRQKTLQSVGAVSREVAHEMWIGLMKVTGADFGAAVTGVAGPSGGSFEKPVGLTFFAVGARGGNPHMIECLFDGGRSQVIEAACDRALFALFDLLSK